jgi:hypothetical protein
MFDNRTTSAYSVRYSDDGLEAIMAFPKAEIEDRLRRWWKRRVASPLRRRVTDPRKTGGTVFDIQPEIASQEVVSILTAIEPILGFRLETSRIIKKGGYQNENEFVTHILPQLELRYLRNNHGATSSTQPAKGVRANVNK